MVISYLNMDTQSFLAVSIHSPITVALACLLTAILIGSRKRNGKVDKPNYTSIEAAPYGIPLVGHVWAFIWDIDGFLRYSRDRAIHGIFSLKMFGIDTHIIHRPSLMKSFFALPASVIEHKTMGSNIITKIFGFPPAEVPRMITHFDELMNTFVTQIMKGPGLERSWGKLLAEIEETVPSLVGPFSDRARFRFWERTANVQAKSNETFEADLFPLVRNCVGFLGSRELMGSAFVDSHPDFLEDIWKIDANIMGFVFGYPGWLPSIADARRGRARILEKLVAWHAHMDAVGPVSDTNAESGPFADVSDLMKQRQRIWSAREFSMEARAGVDLSILWALNANSNSAAYWMLRNIFATPGLLEQVRQEISPFARMTGNRLHIDWKPLLGDCPLFKACYFESLRIDSAPWSFKRLQKGCTVQESTATGGESQHLSTFHLRKGDAVLIPSDLHHTDPRYFENPSEFKPERFFVETTDGGIRSEIKSIRPYGGGSTMCKGRVLAEREVLAFVAAMLTSWDMEPAEGSSWAMDKRVKTSGVSSPRDNLRVTLRKREDGLEPNPAD